MTNVLLFHHVLGVTDESLVRRRTARGRARRRRPGPVGRRHVRVAQGRRRARPGGRLRQRHRARRPAAADLPDGSVVIGFSLGALRDQNVAQNRPGVRGAVLLYSAFPDEEFGCPWPADVAVQIHIAEHDHNLEEGELDGAKALAAEAADGVIHLYPGTAHLIAEKGFADFDPDSAALILSPDQGVPGPDGLVTEPPLLEFVDGAAWEAWLDAHHDVATDAWLRIGKRRPGRRCSRSPMRSTARCASAGSTASARGSTTCRSRQRYCRRRPRSTWSRVNVAKVEALTAAGRMRPGGLAEVTLALADGRWQAAYASQSEATPPPDLVAALAGNPRAQAAFDRLGRSEQYGLLLRLMKTRTPDGRARTLDQVVARLVE